MSVSSVCNVRVVAQAATSASLLIDNVSERVVMPTPGVILYLSFLGDTTANHITTAVNSLVSSKIFNHLDGVPAVEGQRLKPQSLLEVPSCNVLIIPQATLAGKQKGKVVQYHAQCEKTKGEELYYLFCSSMREALVDGSNAASFDRNGRVIVDSAAAKNVATGSVDECDTKEKEDAPVASSTTSHPRLVLNGTYGNRQALTFDSHGPMTHMFEY